MDMVPKVSVAIITYNQRVYLAECIETVLAQDYDNLEIVVGDDASVDGTRELLHSYQQQHPDLFKLVLHETNQGITVNSQSVHEACTGKYVAWMGGDDLMLPGKIRKQVEVFENDPRCDLVYHDLDVFQSESGSHLYFLKDFVKPRQGGVENLIKHGTFNGACATMVRRESTPLHGFDLRLRVASDWLYWVETTIHGGGIRYINEVLGKYRKHSGNVTNYSKHSIGSGMLDELISCQIIIAKYPEYSVQAIYRYARVLFSLRHALNVYCVALSVLTGGIAYFLGIAQKAFGDSPPPRKP